MDYWFKEHCILTDGIDYVVIKCSVGGYDRSLCVDVCVCVFGGGCGYEHLDE